MTTGWGYPPKDTDDEDDADALVLSPFESELLGRLDVIADALTSQRYPLARLLDAEPDDLGRAIKAGAVALGDAFPTLRDAFIPSALKQFAEAVIDGALKQAAAHNNTEADDSPESP